MASDPDTRSAPDTELSDLLADFLPPDEAAALISMRAGRRDASSTDLSPDHVAGTAGLPEVLPRSRPGPEKAANAGPGNPGARKAAASLPTPPEDDPLPSAEDEPEPPMTETGPAFYSGHRARLRTRMLSGDGEALADYEVLEFLLFAASARADTKPTAKLLLKRFGSLAAVLHAKPEKLREVKGIGDAAVGALKIVQVAARRLAKAEILDRPVLSSWDRLLAWCQTELAHRDVEEFHLLFLDKKNRLIAQEAQGRGTVDHTPVYVREVARSALELGATAIIMVHNHPSGDPTPSKADISMTRQVITALQPLGIIVHDHLIIGRSGHLSFKAQGIL